jgi:hypothetical protein
MSEIVEVYSFEESSYLYVKHEDYLTLKEELEREREKNQWTNVKDGLPEIKQEVLFVAKACNCLAHLNGKVMAGNFDGTEFGCAMFSCPGLGIEGTHWMPKPLPPSITQEESKQRPLYGQVTDCGKCEICLEDQK